MPTPRPGAPTGPATIGLAPAIWQFFRDPNASRLGKAFVVLTIGYVLFPLDLIPDVVPIVGWLDDLGLGAVAFAYLHHVSARYRSGTGGGNEEIDVRP